MKKEKYKILVKTYFDKDTQITYTKGSIIELDKEKGEYLEHIECVKKIKSKEDKTKEEKK